jgi:DtxR family Mn-dependent transcriptional regulator
VISPALENYLETILGLVHAKGAARARDIALALSVHKSTVTAALRSLAAKGLVGYSPYESVTLTLAGRRIAGKVARSHGGIRRFLTEVLLLDEKTADANACRMEHVVDRQVTERLELFARYVLAPAAGGFGAFLRKEARAGTRARRPAAKRGNGAGR